MIGTLQHLVDLLRKTLHSQHILQATQQLDSLKTTNGFTSNLILISDHNSVELPIKISALVFLKNLIEEQFKNHTHTLIPHEDLQILKQSILPLLVNLVQKNAVKLIPTMKYICFLFVKYLYKENKWNTLIPQLVKNLELCQSFQTVKATLIVVKILFQVLGKSVMQEIKLNNLATKIILPLISLASKMYANLSIFSCISLEEVFKILTEAIQFHLPEVVHKNIHVFMVLVKNVLDLKYECINLNTNGSESIVRVLRLKRQALVFLRKLYQRHSTSNIKGLENFVFEFNEKYTRAYFETIVGIIMGKNNETPNVANDQQQIVLGLSFSLVTHALGIFSFITNNKQAIKYIEEDLQKYQLKILYLSMEKFLNCHSHKLEVKIKASYKNKEDLFENYSDFLETFRQERQSLALFLTSIFTNKKAQNQQQNVQEILQLLLKCVTSGSLKEIELALYLLSNLQSQIQTLQAQISHNLNQKWLILLKQFVFPLLSTKTEGLSREETFFAKLIQLRAFEMYRRFEYLQIQQDHYMQLCEKIFETLTSPIESQIDLFVKIQAVETFNEVLAAENSLIPKLEAKIPQLLRIYTQLLSRDFEMMKFYEELLCLFNSYISPIVHQLLNLLCDMFFKLDQQKLTKFNCLSTGRSYRNQDNQQEDTVFHDEQILEDSDNETIYEDLKQNYDNIGGQCLGSIKKLLFKYPLNQVPYPNGPLLQQKLLVVVINGLSSRDESFIRECLAILNLLLYKNYLSDNYHFLLPALLYPIFISSNPALAEQIATYAKASTCMANVIRKQSIKDFNSAYIGLLHNLSQDVISRTFAIFDQIGCVKNFIKVLGKRLYELKCQITAKSYLEMLIEAVILIEQASEEQCYSKSEVLSILSIYEVLLQHKVFKSFTTDTLTPFTQDIYFEVVAKNVVKWSVLIENSTFDKQMKERFKSFYFRIIMITIFSYPFEFLKFFQFQVAGQYFPVITNDYPFEKVSGQLGKYLIERTLASIKPLEKVKQDSMYVLNDTYVTFKGIASLVRTLVNHFIIVDEQKNLITLKERLKIINLRSNCLFSRLYYIIIKLSLHVIFLTLKESDEKMQHNIQNFNHISHIQNTINQMISQGIGQEIQSHQISQTNFLVSMLAGLNIKTQDLDSTVVKSGMEENSSDNQLTQPKKIKYEIKYQQDLKRVGQMIDDSDCSSDKSDLGSFDSSEGGNPFECEQQEYLYAYDSVVFGGLFMQNRRKWLQKMLHELQSIIEGIPISILKDTFQVQF